MNHKQIPYNKKNKMIEQDGEEQQGKTCKMVAMVREVEII